MPPRAKIKGKKKHKNKPTSQKWKKYQVEGDKITKQRTCPRCGPGIFLAKSKTGDRFYCGRCHFTEFLGSSQSEKQNT